MSTTVCKSKDGFEVSTPKEYAKVVVTGSLTGLVWFSVLFQDSHIDCTLICN